MNIQIFGIVLLVAGAALVVGAKWAGRAWIDASPLGAVKFIPTSALPWIGAAVSAIFGLALVAIAARLLGWWG